MTMVRVLEVRFKNRYQTRWMMALAHLALFQLKVQAPHKDDNSVPHGVMKVMHLCILLLTSHSWSYDLIWKPSSLGTGTQYCDLLWSIQGSHTNMIEMMNFEDGWELDHLYLSASWFPIMKLSHALPTVAVCVPWENRFSTVPRRQVFERQRNVLTVRVPTCGRSP